MYFLCVCVCVCRYGGATRGELVKRDSHQRIVPLRAHNIQVSEGSRLAHVAISTGVFHDAAQLDQRDQAKDNQLVQAGVTNAFLRRQNAQTQNKHLLEKRKRAAESKMKNTKIMASEREKVKSRRR